MDAAEFVNKWQKVELTERSAAQQHYLNLCQVFGHPEPADADPSGSWYTFERSVEKAGGRRGFADVWKRGQFAWEYKKKHKDLNAAFDQLLQYSGNLGNPPLLLACDMDRIVVRTHFTGFPTVEHEVTLDKFTLPKNLELLRKVFHDPQALQPEETIEVVTKKAAEKFAKVVPGLRERFPGKNTAIAHFLDRIVFCLFAEDVGILPDHLFTKIVANVSRDPRRVTKDIADLFKAMAEGGDVYGKEVPWFNGNLFDATPPLDLAGPETEVFAEASKLDWSQMDPTIFGTLFERVMDPSQRSRLGAHYTGFTDIQTLVEPVVMAPLRREWDACRERVHSLLPDVVLWVPAETPSGATGRTRPVPRSESGDTGRVRPVAPDGSNLPTQIEPTPAEAHPQNVAEAQSAIDAFLARLRAVRVLDPACGSGNFLYVTLKLLKDLEKSVLDECRFRGLPAFELKVGPHQLHGIEINPYAHDLAQMTVWIGHLQWLRANGYPITQTPILQRLDTIQLMDAILDLSDPDFPKEPVWPEADFIVGNPPFLGYSPMRKELGDAYLKALWHVYENRVSNQGDLCCYWFERSRQAVHSGRCWRAGLLATQAIRGGKNRDVLRAIKRDGNIFFAVSDQNWVQDGANVHVSMVGFDNGTETTLTLDGQQVSEINPNLSGDTNTTLATRLPNNVGLSFIGGFKFGSFDITDAEAIKLLHLPSLHAQPNSSVVRPWINGLSILRRQEPTWIIDFGIDLPVNEAALFEAPFSLVLERVKPERDQMRRERRRERWWLHGETANNLRIASETRERIIVTPRVSKHRIFVWRTLETSIDSALVAFARSDDYFFGVLHSRLHEVWARSQGTQVRERESGFRYTPTTCFETFPFPEPTADQVAAIGGAAKRLDELRTHWLNPPEWTRTETLEFPGSVDGPWRRFVHEADSRGIGTVRYPRVVARDSHVEDLAKRTLTNLYNARPTWLDQAHKKLDAATFAAYGWPADLSDDAILARLLALNFERAGSPAAEAEPG